MHDGLSWGALHRSTSTAGVRMSVEYFMFMCEREFYTLHMSTKGLEEH